MMCKIKTLRHIATILTLFVLLTAFSKTANAAVPSPCEDEGYTCRAGCGSGLEPKSFNCTNPGDTCCGPAPEYESKCSELENQTLEGAPSPLAILCPLVRYLNVILFASAAVFVTMVFLSALKYAMSQGDPKALQGAKGALTWAIIGFIVIIGVFTMLVILKNVLGLKDNIILNPVGVLNKNLMDLFDKFGITNY